MLRTHGMMPACVSRSISSGLLAHSSAYLHATTHVRGCGGLVDAIVVGSYGLCNSARGRLFHSDEVVLLTCSL